MPSWPIRDRRWEWDRRTFEERRRAPDRRDDPDRAASGDADGTDPDTARTYVFRSFSDRRRRDDRRALPIADRRARPDSMEDDRTVDLSPEEVLALLHQPDE